MYVTGRLTIQKLLKYLCYADPTMYVCTYVCIHREKELLKMKVCKKFVFSVDIILTTYLHMSYVNMIIRIFTYT